MEEKKCCVDNICEKCVIGRCCKFRCCNPASKVVAVIILIALAFYLGTLCNGKYDFRGQMGSQKFMNRIYDTNKENPSVYSGSVTVKVTPQENTETNTPPVSE